MNAIVSFIDGIAASLGCTMSSSDLTLKMVLTVFILVFIGGFMDAIAGGGGLITLPAYLMSGLPAHVALGTNKTSSCLGSSVAVVRYVRSGYVKWSLALPCIVLAICGSSVGTNLQLRLSDVYLKYILLFVLPVVAVIVLRRRSLPEAPGDISFKKQLLVCCLAALVIGMYDGFYGPGTGTFLLLIFCNLAKLDVRTANGNTKLVNFSSNIAAFATSLMNGQVFILLGLIGAVASMSGNYLGSGLAIKNGSRIVRPTVIAVLILLVIKVLTGLKG